MKASTKNIFTTIWTEGAILPADLLRRIGDGDKDLEGLKPTSYHLLEGEKLNEAINRSWTRLRGAWAGLKAAIEKLPTHDAGTSVTRDRFLLPFLQELGYGRLTVAKALESGDKNYPISHGYQHTPIHLVGWRVELDQRTAGVAGAARSSPHSLVQELLNRSDEHLWAFISNGRQWRILRDNASLTRQAYVEFDLEAMMVGEVYADFVLLWLLCHQSRVEAEKPEQCWLEKWSKTAQEQGTRALEQLRNGVEAAITTLGQGFLSHPLNRELRRRLQTGELATQDYYRQLLRLVYRLLFLFVAEDREVLLDPKADLVAIERYQRYYSTARLRQLAEQRRGTRHADLFYGLRLVMEKLDRLGCPELGLPALGSFLWSREAIADLEACQIANAGLLEAIRALAFIQDQQGRRPVDYKNLRSEELGSVYEALLELHPELNIGVGTFVLKTASGNERKTTGSYYTPESLVQCLLDSALDPVVDEACGREDAEAALLKLKVCDTACGSGHFLIAAAHRMAKRLAAIRTGETEPAPEAIRTALRDVIGRCVYGVDLNPMAVELCKVALWMEAIEPGKPLSFLDHHILCGNSLLGATPALLKQGIPDAAFTAIEGDDKAYCSKFKKLNKEERSGQLKLFDLNFEPWQRLGDLATSLVSLDQIADDSIEGIRRKQEQYESLVKSTPYLFSRFWADAWCASFVWKKTQEFPYPITDEVFRRIERNPHSVEKWMRDEVMRLAGQYAFFHWHLAFPDVFRVDQSEEPENEQTGWNGGFDVILGNPPWERIKLQEKEWFATRLPQIANATNAAARRKMITALKTEDSSLHNAWLEDSRQAEGESQFVRLSQRYPLCGRGDVNTYAIFAETNRTILNGIGRVGCIVPSGIATDDTTKFFFKNLMELGSLVSLHSFENEEFLFVGVHHAFKFCLITMTGYKRPQKLADFLFFARQTSNLQEQDRHFSLSAEDLALLNPTTRTCLIFRKQHDAELTKAIYRNVKSFEQTEWNGYYIRLIHLGDHAESVRLQEHLKIGEFNNFNEYICEEEHFLRIYEAKLMHHFDYRYATFENVPQKDTYDGKARELTLEEHSNPNISVKPRYWVEKKFFREIVSKYPDQSGWLLAYRDITSATNERTCIATALPETPATVSVPCLGVNGGLTKALLQSNLSTFCLDYVVRQKVAGSHLTFGILKQLPIIDRSVYNQTVLWHLNSDVKSLIGWILPRVLELTYTSWDLQPFAQDCGYNGSPFRWDNDRRFLLRCELDAAYFHLYSIDRDDVDYIMETFPIVKRKDEKAYGHYRTKNQILEIYDAMAEAMKEHRSYQTLLDPPPADPQVAHPPR